MPKELDVVRLRDGRKGTVVFVYRNGEAYSVEISVPNVSPEEKLLRSIFVTDVINVGPEDIVEAIYEAPESKAPESGS